jgi:hypothetical protein
MEKKIISEIQIIPVKPQKGLLAFCTFVLFDSIYCSSVAIYSKLTDGFRLVYPTKAAFGNDLNVFYPINKKTGDAIQDEVIKKFKEVMNIKSDRYDFLNN